MSGVQAAVSDGLIMTWRNLKRVPRIPELAIEHFFNIQLVGEHVSEINPRITTIVYQEDFNLPWLGVKHALGELSPAELDAARARIRPSRRALRYFEQVEWDD